MKYRLCFFLLFCSLHTVFSQQNHKGKEFYTVLLPNAYTDLTVFYISSDEKTSGNFYLRHSSGTIDTIPFSITNPSQSTIVTTNDDDFLVVGASQYDQGIYKDNLKPSKRSIHIVSEKDIEVSMVHYSEYTSDRTLLYPVHACGKEYTVMAPPSKYFQTIENNKPVINYHYSQCAITAIENNTSITVSSPVNIIGDFERTVTALLQKGESYLVQGRPTVSDTSADLTGTSIKASAPVSVIAGAAFFEYGLLKNKLYISNAVFDQILPSDRYGTRYIVTDPIKSRTDKTTGPNYYTVTAMTDTATIKVNDVKVAFLQKGEHITLPLQSFSVVHGSSPIGILILRRSSGAIDGASTTPLYGDPFMVDLPAMEYWNNRYTVNVETVKKGNVTVYFPDNYVNIVIPTSVLSQLTINNKPVDKTLFTRISSFPQSGICTDMSFGTISLAPSNVIIEAPVPFGMYSYGYTVTDAYGYIPGRNLNPIEFPVVRSSYRDTIICPGTSVRLSAQGGDNTYSWSPKEGLSCTDCPNPIATPIKNTSYTVTSNNAFGCPVLKDTVRIIIQPALVDAGKDVGICSGDSIRLSVNEGKIYLWSPAEGLSCTDCREPFAKPIKNQRYYVTLTDKNGCIGTDSVLVSVGKPTADAGKDTTICLGASVRMRASGGNTYRWSPSPDLSCTDCPDPIITPKQSTTYTVISYLSANCFAMDSVHITVESTKAEITADKTILCPTDSVTLSAKGGIKVQWNGEGIRCTDCIETKASPMQSGYYIVTVTTATGCTAKDSIYITVNKPSVKVSPDTVICKGNKAYLRAEGGIKYSWSPATGLSCTDCAKPEASPLQTTRYTVTSYDNNNCTAQASVLITVDSCPIIIKADTIILTSSLNCALSIDKQSYTHHSDKPLQLQEPELISGDGSAFRVTYNVPTNSTLNNNNELIVTTELLSTSSTPKQVLYRLGTSQERELHLKATGEYITKTAMLKPKDTIGVVPGEGYVPIHLVSDGDIEQIRELRTVLSFPTRFMNYVPNKHSIRSISGWNFGIEAISENNGMTYLTLYGKGNTPLQKNTPITSIETDMYLGDSVQFTIMTEQSEVPKECYTIPQGRGIVGLGGCFANGRAINTGLPYSVQAKTENNTLILNYTAGLDGITECSLLNTLGEHIADITYRTDSKGEYNITYPMEALSSGNYIVLFRSGIFRQSILINLVR